jgi:hypothetical protein
MQIIYADDEPRILEQVCGFLQQHGHEVYTLSTANLLDFQKKLTDLLESGFVPEVVITGGHNILRDGDGLELVDVEGFVINKWLGSQHLPADCRFILFSRHPELVEKAQHYPVWGFQASVLKGNTDSLVRLLGVIENKAL